MQGELDKSRVVGGSSGDGVVLPFVEAQDLRSLCIGVIGHKVNQSDDVVLVNVADPVGCNQWNIACPQNGEDGL